MADRVKFLVQIFHLILSENGVKSSDELMCKAVPKAMRVDPLGLLF
jgi:hypothetical protein